VNAELGVFREGSGGETVESGPEICVGGSRNMPGYEMKTSVAY
jgi:hypothetical protein